MDYEQKHKDDLEAAKGWLAIAKENNCKIAIQILEKFFPELKESEDEKIRKELLNHLKEASYGKTLVVSTLDYKRWADWLEKQGEQKSNKEFTFKALPRLLDMIEPTDKAKAYCQKLIDSLENEGYTVDAKIVGECLKGMNGEKVAMATMDEQKPAWSEEDEKMLSGIINDTEQGALLDKEQINWLKSLKPQSKQEWSEANDSMIEGIKIAILNYYDKENADEIISWLESIKDRVQPQPKQEWSEEDEGRISWLIKHLSQGGGLYDDLIIWLKSIKPNHWKPTEEQMEALEHFVRSIGESGYASPYDNNTKLIHSLINDLKSL